MSERIAIRGDWGTIAEVEPGLFRLRLFNGRGSLQINTYVYKGPNSLSVIDPGWPWTFDGLEAALNEVGLGSVGEVDGWYYTHTHIDHMGLAAILQDHSDAPHHALETVAPYLERWHSFQDRMNDWSRWGGEAFAEPHRSLLLDSYAAERGASPRGMVAEHGERAVENFVPFSMGDVLELGDLQVRVLDARGHDRHHVAFWEESRGWLFVGDAVIATPTPVSRAMEDNLKLYESTLERLSKLNTKLLLPGHGVQKSERIQHAIDKSRGYVETYRRGVLEVLNSNDGPLNLYELGLQMSPKQKPMQPSARWWVHLALVDSHLQWLEAEQLVVRNSGPTYHTT